jgi:hypothetical protein
VRQAGQGGVKAVQHAPTITVGAMRTVLPCSGIYARQWPCPCCIVIGASSERDLMELSPKHRVTAHSPVTEISTGAPGLDRGLSPTEAPTARLFFALAGGSTVPTTPWYKADVDDPVLLPLAVLLLVLAPPPGNVLPPGTVLSSDAAVLLELEPAPEAPRPAVGGAGSPATALPARRLPGAVKPALLLLLLPRAVVYLGPLGLLSLLGFSWLLLDMLLLGVTSSKSDPTPLAPRSGMELSSVIANKYMRVGSQCKHAIWRDRHEA